MPIPAVPLDMGEFPKGTIPHVHDMDVDFPVFIDGA